LNACESALGGPASRLALAATEQEIAVAWFSGTNSGYREPLRFTRFAPDLTRLSETESGFASARPEALAMVPYPDGWVVAVEHDENDAMGVPIPAVELHTFDRAGAYRGRARRIEGASAPFLASRPSGAPLLAYAIPRNGAPNEVMVSVLSSDLAGGTAPLALGQAFSASTAAFVGDAFLVPIVVGPSVRVTRIELDGTRVAPTHDVGYGTFDEHVAMTSAGPLLYFYENNGEGFSFLVSLDAQGVPKSTAKVPTSGYRVDGMLGIGSDVVIASREGDGLKRLSPSGAEVWQQPIAAYPGFLGAYRIAQRGPDLVVGWVSGEGLGLAKVDP
jgi:hypothetical protein